MSLRKDLISHLMISKQNSQEDELNTYIDLLNMLSVSQLQELTERQEVFAYERDKQEDNEVLRGSVNGSGKKGRDHRVFS